MLQLASSVPKDSKVNIRLVTAGRNLARTRIQIPIEDITSIRRRTHNRIDRATGNHTQMLILHSSMVQGRTRNSINLGKEIIIQVLTKNISSIPRNVRHSIHLDRGSLIRMLTKGSSIINNSSNHTTMRLERGIRVLIQDSSTTRTNNSIDQDKDIPNRMAIHSQTRQRTSINLSRHSLTQILILDSSSILNNVLSSTLSSTLANTGQVTVVRDQHTAAHRINRTTARDHTSQGNRMHCQ